jgi:hypothetical protein
LKDDAGHALSVQSGRYDQMPLDCGRSDCHAAIAQSAADSPMTQALASDLGGCHSLEKPECATACHATGEPGTDDGGFQHVAASLGLPALPSEYEELPTPLRRLSGVGCMACHGAAAIPEPSARWAVLRSDVCAVCHDAAPRYGHVQARLRALPHELGRGRQERAAERDWRIRSLLLHLPCRARAALGQPENGARPAARLTAASAASEPARFAARHQPGLRIVPRARFADLAAGSERGRPDRGPGWARAADR